MKGYREQLNCGFPQVRDVFDDCMAEALSVLSKEGIAAYLEAAGFLCRMGRGVEPVLIFLEEWPSVAKILGEPALPAVMEFIRKMYKSPNGKAIVPFLQTLAATARTLAFPGADAGIHGSGAGFHAPHHRLDSRHPHHLSPAPACPMFYAQTPYLLSQISLQGLKNWVEYGIRNYGDHPERQIDYFSLQSADSKAVMQRERHGTLLVDNERKLDLYLRGLWEHHDYLVPYSLGFDELRKPIPYYDKLGIRLPDVYDDFNGIAGIDRYRATLAHIIGHKRWTTAIFADNFSPFQRMAVEFFEDARVEYLAMQRIPRPAPHLSWHCTPRRLEGACDPETTSCLRHRLAMLSRALLDPEHGYRNPLTSSTSSAASMKSWPREHPAPRKSPISPSASSPGPAARATSSPRCISTTPRSSYRDDNRQMWQFIEEERRRRDVR